MGLLKPVRWLGKLLQRSISTRAGPPTSSIIQGPRIAAFPPSSQRALRRLVSHASLQECRQGIAKTTAFSVQHHATSQTPRRRNGSVDLHQFTHSNAAGREPFGEDIAARNIAAEHCNNGKPGRQDIWKEGDPFQAYATYNPHQLRKKVIAKALDEERRPVIGPSGRKQPRDADALPWTPRNRRKGACDDASDQRSTNESDVDSVDPGPEIVHASIISLPSRPRSLSHKRSIYDLRRANRLCHKRSQTFPGADPPGMSVRPPITRADLDKPLPALPYDRTYDTTMQTRWQPAVTHQTIQRDVHEIHQDHVTNEYHQDEYRHRVLPILDQEILPARHFIQLDGGGLEEISESDIPFDLPLDLQQRISEAAATIFSERFRDSGVSFGSMDGSADPGSHSHHSFSFASMDGTLEHTQTSRRDSVTPQGHARRDTTWTYPPAFLPMQHGTEQHNQVLFNLGSDDLGEGKAHARALSDGPPPIPVRGVPTSGCVREEFMW